MLFLCWLPLHIKFSINQPAILARILSFHIPMRMKKIFLEESLHGWRAAPVRRSNYFQGRICRPHVDDSVLSHHIIGTSQEPIHLEITRTKSTQLFCICGFYIHEFKQLQIENIWKNIASVIQMYSHPCSLFSK